MADTTFDLSNFEKDPFRPEYAGNFDIAGQDVKIELSGGPEEPTEDLQQRLTRRMDWFLSQLDSILAYITSELLENKNDDWLEEDESPWEAGPFQKAMRLRGLRITPEDYFEIHYYPGKLFWGHWVVVGVTADDQLDFATLEG